MNEQLRITGTEHWTSKDGGVKLFLWNSTPAIRQVQRDESCSCTLVHGLDADLRPAGAGASVGDGFLRGQRLRHLVRRHGGLWSLHQDPRQQRAIAYGADDCFAAASYIEKLRGKKPLLVYGISSGALRSALFAQRHPELVARLACDAMVWTGEGSPRSPSAARGCRSFARKIAARSTANSCARSSSAIIPAPPTMS